MVSDAGVESIHLSEYVQIAAVVAIRKASRQDPDNPVTRFVGTGVPAGISSTEVPYGRTSQAYFCARSTNSVRCMWMRGSSLGRLTMNDIITVSKPLVSSKALIRI